MYAVDPEQVKKNATLITQDELLEYYSNLGEGTCKTLTISGGNPLMWDLSTLCRVLRKDGWDINVETQGTIWKDWLLYPNFVTFSPKPPSSGMADFKMEQCIRKAWTQLQDAEVCIKIVVFDIEDYLWAKHVINDIRSWPIPDRTPLRTPKPWTFYLQPGTDQAFNEPAAAGAGCMSCGGEYNLTGIESVRNDILERTKWITKAVLNDLLMVNVRIMPQVHSLVFGYARGV